MRVHQHFAQEDIFSNGRKFNFTEPHIGSWGTYDLGLTELIQKLLGGGTLTEQQGSNLSGPYQSTTGLNTELGTPVSVPKIDNTGYNIDPNTPGLNTFTGGNTGGTGGGGTGGAAPSGGGGAPGLDFGAIINRQRQAAEGLFNRARGLYDQGMSALGEKRKQFQGVFDQGQGDILQGFEKGAGELQSSSMGARERNANALRALGLGGSAVVRTKGKERQQEAKGLAGLQDIRGANERQNKTAFDENSMWANNQEAGLGNYLRNAQDARGAAENTIVDNVGSLFNNILNNQMAYNASIGQRTASPYQVDIPSMMNTLTGVLSSAGLTSGAQTDQNVNIPENQSYLDWIKQRAAGGVAGQGLYA